MIAVLLWLMHYKQLLTTTNAINLHFICFVRLLFWLLCVFYFAVFVQAISWPTFSRLELASILVLVVSIGNRSSAQPTTMNMHERVLLENVSSQHIPVECTPLPGCLIIVFRGTMEICNLLCWFRVGNPSWKIREYNATWNTMYSIQ